MQGPAKNGPLGFQCLITNPRANERTGGSQERGGILPGTPWNLPKNAFFRKVLREVMKCDGRSLEEVRGLTEISHSFFALPEK